MVKLIVADMDGTLLRSDKRLSPRFFPMLRELTAQDVRFAVASGRQYYNLLRYFEPVKNDIAFIADNGGIVYECGMNTFTDEIPYEKLCIAAEAVRRIPGAFPVFSGANSAYFESVDEELLKNASLYYEKRAAVPNVLEAAKYDRIAKVAVYDSIGAERNSYPSLSAKKDLFQVTLAGESWTDLMNPGLSKGRALANFQACYGILPAETMAFGDYLNDYEMMPYAAYSYAMENAHPELKKICSYSARSNDEDGVINAIVSFFGLSL